MWFNLIRYDASGIRVSYTLITDPRTPTPPHDRDRAGVLLDIRIASCYTHRSGQDVGKLFPESESDNETVRHKSETAAVEPGSAGDAHLCGASRRAQGDQAAHAEAPAP